MSIKKSVRVYLITCLVEGLKRVTHDQLIKFKEVTQTKYENTAQFMCLLVTTLKKLTNLNPKTWEGQLILKMQFITQSASAIKKKTPKIETYPQTPQEKLI